MQENQIANQPELVELLAKALGVNTVETAEAKAAKAAYEARMDRIGKAPKLPFFPPDPLEVDLNDYVRILNRIDSEARGTRGYTSDLHYLEFESNDRTEYVKVDAVQAGVPVFLPKRFLNPAGLTSVRELNALVKLGLCELGPASIDNGKSHLSLLGESAYRYGFWSCRRWLQCWESGDDEPPLRAAELIAGMVDNAQPKLAKILRNFAAGSRDISGADKVLLFPQKTGGGNAQDPGQNPNFQKTTALVES